MGFACLVTRFRKHGGWIRVRGGYIDFDMGLEFYGMRQWNVGNINDRLFGKIAGTGWRIRLMVSFHSFRSYDTNQRGTNGISYI